MELYTSQEAISPPQKFIFKEELFFILNINYYECDLSHLSALLFKLWELALPSTGCFPPISVEQKRVPCPVRERRISQHSQDLFHKK